MVFNPFSRKQQVAVNNNQVPLVNMLAGIKDMLKYSPDAADLSYKRAHLCFIVDNMKRGHRHHEFLARGEGKFFCPGFSCRAFNMWKRDLGKETFPIPFEDQDAFTPRSKIRGELYLIPTETILAIDKLRENGVQFMRKRVRIEIPYHIFYLDSDDAHVVYKSRNYRQTLSPWMWVGISDYWNDLVNGIQFSQVSQKHFGEHFALRHTVRESSKYYEFSWEDYFNEDKVIHQPKKVLYKFDDVGNQYTEVEWQAHLAYKKSIEIAKG